jgi:hypothetical protein
MPPVDIERVGRQSLQFRAGETRPGIAAARAGLNRTLITPRVNCVRRGGKTAGSKASGASQRFKRKRHGSTRLYRKRIHEMSFRLLRESLCRSSLSP